MAQAVPAGEGLMMDARRVLLAGVLGLVPVLCPAAATAPAWVKAADDPSSFGALSRLPAGTEVWQLTKFGGFVGVTEKVQAWRGGGKGQLAYGSGRRWQVSAFDGAQAERLWKALEAARALRLSTTPTPTAPDAAMGWAVSSFRVPAGKVTPDALFPGAKMVAPGDLGRVQEVLKLLRQEFGMPAAAGKQP